MARFAKGVSGNPAGRPRRGLSVAERVRRLGGEDGEQYLRVLHEIALNERESTRCRIQAIQLLLGRGWGAEPQQVDVEVKSPLSPAEIRESLRAAGVLNQPRQSETVEVEPAWRERMNAWIDGDL